MPALVSALNKVDFPTLGSPTIPHFKLMSVPANEAGKCMRWAGAWLLGAVLLLASVAQAAQEPPAAQPAPARTILLRDSMEEFAVQDLAQVWVDPAGDARIEQ